MGWLYVDIASRLHPKYQVRRLSRSPLTYIKKYTKYTKYTQQVLSLILGI